MTTQDAFLPLASRSRDAARAEAPTLAMLAAVGLGWGALIAWGGLAPWLAAPLMALVLAQHSSLQHEILHGHPTPSARLNAALAFPAIGLLVPYERFRDTHLAHHRDPRLTDPYDDPESNYMDPAVWAGLGRPARALLRANNTLLGRMLLGPAISLYGLHLGDARAARRGDGAVIRAYAMHAAGLAPVAAIWALGTLPAWAYAAGAYGCLSLLKIRTFAEHRAHESACGRTVVIEDRGPLALLFLNNNLHAVHHAHPNLPWYRLPAEYAARREEFARRTRGYVLPSYRALFARHLLTPKDPVPHPIWTQAKRSEPDEAVIPPGGPI